MIREVKDAPSVDEVVLVGGCARIPHLQHLFSAAFPEAHVTIPERDDAAARGAAVQVGLVRGRMHSRTQLKY